MESKVKLLIIGSGTAGYTSAIYAGRAALFPTLITGNVLGGQLMITTDVENFPGFPIVQGPVLMDYMKKQVERSDVNLINDNVCYFSKLVNSNLFCIKTDSGRVFMAKSVIIATGAEAKWLGLPSELKYRGHGVSGCAVCDAFLYKGKKVIVVGGGNTAVEEALYLSKYASQVMLIHRRNRLKAEMCLQKKLFLNSKIKILWNSVLKEVLGLKNPLVVQGAKIIDLDKSKEYIIDAEGIFIAIGHSPNSKLFANDIDVDHEGYIVTKPKSTETSIPGVFAAGDVQDKIYRQAATAAGSGCMAALEAIKYIG